MKQDFLNIGSTHCFIHCEGLMAKTIPPELKIILDRFVKMVNFVMSVAFKIRILNEFALKQDLSMTLWFSIPRSTGCQKVKS